MKTNGFNLEFKYAGLVDMGSKRQSNQDEIALAPSIPLFAVSDGMGGLDKGGVASEYVKKAFPVLIESDINLWDGEDDETIKTHLGKSVCLLSDRLFEQGNTTSWYRFGATLVGVILHDNKAFFVNLGDSRGYMLPYYKKNLRQVTKDMNIARYLVEYGEMKKEEAKDSPESSRLTSFVGIEPPANPETYAVELKHGDRILLCSDGLYGMVPEREIAKIMRSSKSPEKVCKRLIDKANEYGGRDNISAVYIYIY